EMLEELPDADQIAALVDKLSVKVIRQMMADLLGHNIEVAKNPDLYPYEFAERLSSWIATAQELVASKGRVSKLLRDREKLRNTA
ncbi:MAG: hypothetical protein MN733_09745, partial [Nitrososphaera sp.]|nr:hypothetical protein [Nitrososphaera sp.]